jgi:hypothetical protein
MYYPPHQVIVTRALRPDHADILKEQTTMTCHKSRSFTLCVVNQDGLLKLRIISQLFTDRSDYRRGNKRGSVTSQATKLIVSRPDGIVTTTTLFHACLLFRLCVPDAVPHPAQALVIPDTGQALDRRRMCMGVTHLADLETEYIVGLHTHAQVGDDDIAA